MTIDEIKQKARKDYGNLILEIMKTDPEFKEQFKELLNKKDDSDKDIIIDIGLPAAKVDDDKMRYTIATGKKITEWSFSSLQSISLSRRLMKDLYEQLKKLLKDES